MATPIWSYRVRPEHQNLLRSVADALKANPQIAQDIERALSGNTSGRSGPFISSEAAEKFIVGRLVLELHPEEIWLFGSRGRGTNRPESDYDILVVFDDERSETRDYARVRRPLAASGLACDVVPCSKSEFKDARDRRGTIAFEAAYNGRLLFKRADRKTRAA